MISKDCRPNCEQRQGEDGGLPEQDSQRSSNRNWNVTGAEPLFGPLVFTSFPSISKPSVGRLPSGRADLSPTCWQSTDRETLTWLTDRWTCHTQRRQESSHKLSQMFFRGIKWQVCGWWAKNGKNVFN